MARTSVKGLLLLPFALSGGPPGCMAHPQMPSEVHGPHQAGLRRGDAARSKGANATVTYRQPGICETTPGVKSYSGYVDLDEASHTFFWYFEARKNVRTAPITVWLNGGPGTDSLMGLFGGGSHSTSEQR